MDKGHKEVKPRNEYVPPKCSSCTALSEGKNFTYVYCVNKSARMTTRYCKCRYCGATFKDCETIN